MNHKPVTTAKKDSPAPVKELFDEALAHHQAGRLAEAEPLYRQVLALDPAHADSLHLLGVLAGQNGHPEIAVEMIGRAIALKDSPVFHDNQGMAFKNTDRLDEAEASFRRALVLDPDHAGAHFNLGDVLRDLGKNDEAVICLQCACALRPDWAEARNNLGAALRRQGRTGEAIVQYERAIALNPGFAEACNNLGNALREQGRLDDAITHYERAIALKPDIAEFHNSLGEVYSEKGRLNEATAHHKRAIALKPDYAAAHNNLGVDLHGLGWLDEAIVCYRRTIVLDSGIAIAHSNLGTCLKEQGHLDEAMACYRRGIALLPEFADTYNNLLLAMIYAASVSPADLAATAREFGEKLADPLRRQRPLIRDIDPERKLRIGYVSADFYNHAVNYFFEPLLKLHDREKFEVFAYFTARNFSGDHVTARLRQEFDHWRDVGSLSDDDAADLIEADEIDILVDLAGHTGYNRLLVFARKPAPVQVAWLGFPATTGLKAMDYRITDNHAEPPGMTEHLNTETLWRLPGIFCCYQARENSPAVIDHPPFEENGHVTFGCFNNFAKVTDPVLKTWARIIARVPKSKLLLEINGITSPPFRISVENRLLRAGLPLGRVILEPRKPENQFVLYNRIDIALDPFPCNGGTTSMDTLWMGVPFITLVGEHFVSRMGVTILTNAGLPELIAKNVDEYVDLAVNLALDKNRLRGLRHNLRRKVAASAIMNQAAFARNMEAAYREMWRKWCEDKDDVVD